MLLLQKCSDTAHSDIINLQVGACIVNKCCTHTVLNYMNASFNDATTAYDMAPNTHDLDFKFSCAMRRHTMDNTNMLK